LRVNERRRLERRIRDAEPRPGDYIEAPIAAFHPQPKRVSPANFVEDLPALVRAMTSVMTRDGGKRSVWCRRSSQGNCRIRGRYRRGFNDGLSHWHLMHRGLMRRRLMRGRRLVMAEPAFNRSRILAI
jgi:hypothetical protein